MMSIVAIVAGSMAIAWLARRLEVVRWMTVGALLGMTLLAMAPTLLSGDIPVPLDEVARGYPWRGPSGIDDARNPVANDTARQMLPWMEAVRMELFSGRAPLWNKWSLSGYPLLGNGQSAPFFPLFVATLWVPLPDQIVAMAGLKLFTGLLFGLLLIRREGVSEGEAAFGSVVYALSILVVVYLYYPLGSALLLVPMAAWAILRCLDVPGWSSVVVAAIAVGALQTAGHPETVFHAAIVVGLLVLVELIAPARDGKPRLEGILSAALGTTAGMLLSAPAWMPVLAQVLESMRVTEIGRGGLAGQPFPPGALWILLNPNGYGHPVRESWGWIMNYPMVASSYLGLLPLALLPAALLAGKSRDRLLVGAGLMLGLLAFNWTLVGRSFSELAPWIAHDRLRFGAILLFGMAGARQLGRLRAGRRWALTIAGSLAAMAGMIYLWMALHERTLLARDLVGVAAIATFWIVVIGMRWRSRGREIGWVAASLVVVELVALGAEYNAPVRRNLFAFELPIVESLRSQASDRPFRIVGVDWTFLPNASVLYGLEDIRGSDPMAWEPYTRFLDGFDVEDPASNVQRVADLTAPQLDFLNVEFALSDPDWSGAPGWTQLYRGPDGILWRNEEALARAYLPTTVEYVKEEEVHSTVQGIDDFRRTVVAVARGDRELMEQQGGEVSIEEQRPGRYVVRTAPSSVVRFVATSIPALPGWVVEAGGATVPMERINGAFIGFRLPAGERMATLRYEPVPWRISLWMSVLGMLFLAAGRRVLGVEGRGGEKKREVLE